MYCAVKNTSNAGNTIKQSKKMVSVPAGKMAKGVNATRNSIQQRYKAFIDKFTYFPSAVVFLYLWKPQHLL
jgi:hypothetical protein